jgi:fermentation-respiration switch protein FrsA (DUF1100 family)
MVKWMKEVRAMPHEDFYINAFDGKRLHGRYYEYAPGAPIELMVHGYRGNGDRDLCGGVQRCFKLGRSALVIDQRASGESDGRVITFGIKEHKDCRAWAEFMAEHFGPDAKIILTGISMGASTVLMAAGAPLPPQVKGVLADCGFSTAKDIIQKVIQQMKLPVKLLYPFVRLGAIIYGGFDPEQYSALEAVKSATVPVIFFHGETDDFVPHEMSQSNFDACSSHKQLVVTPGAGHGLCYPVDPKVYLQALRDFFGPELSTK